MMRSVHEEATRLLAEKKFRQALVLYTQFTKDHPSEAEGWQGVAQCYLGLSEYDQALVFAKKATELDPGSSSPHVILAYGHLNTGDIEKSSREANLAYQLSPDSAEVLACLGTVSLLEKKTEEAIRMLESALDQNPNLAIAHRNLAYIYGQMGQDAMVVQHRKGMFIARPSITNGYFLLLAYMKQHFVITAVVMLIIMGLAYFFGLRFLFLIPLFFAGHLLWSILSSNFRRT